MYTRVPLFYVIFFSAGALFLASNAFSQTEISTDEVTQESLRFTQIYSVLERDYVGRVDPDQAILEGGIRGMLSTLDPFSAFFNREQFQMLQEQARGKALGFGSILYVQPGKIVILQTADHSPSWRAGLGPGDEIVEVNGNRIDRLDFESLIELLKRSRSQPVTLGVIRPGKVVAQDFKLTPAEVDLPTVDRAFRWSPGIAYVHVTGFEEKTPQEVAEAISRLGGASLRGVVLDLRDNHGGMLDAAVATASFFLQPDLVVLTVRGRAMPEKSYRTSRAPAHFNIPLILLVNGNTASAAEILAAALEEHDRALIAGEPTFGKGVVESVMALSEQSGLALTTAQYFTASGRSIQRPLPGTALAVAGIEGVSLPASGLGEQGAALQGGEPHTDLGRPVSAGGGITPDVEIPARALDPWVTFLNQRGTFSNFASEYLTRHGPLDRTFEPDSRTLDDFKDFLGRHGIRAPEEFWTPDQAYLKLRIRTEIFNLVFGLAAGDEVETRGDPQVEKAVALFPRLPQLLKAPGEKAGAAHAKGVTKRQG